MIQYMYIALGQGQTAPRGQSFDVNRNVLSLCSFLASLKKNVFKSDFIHFFHDLYMYMYIAPGQEQAAPRGQNFDVNRKGYHFTHGHYLNKLGSMRCCIPSFKVIGLLVPEKKIFYVFYYFWAWWPPWSCDNDRLNKFSFPHL